MCLPRDEFGLRLCKNQILNRILLSTLVHLLVCALALALPLAVAPVGPVLPTKPAGPRN